MGPWLGLELIRYLELERVSRGREEIPWAIMVEVLVLCRLCHPLSEMHIAKHFYEHPENIVLWTGMKDVSAEGRKLVSRGIMEGLYSVNGGGGSLSDL